MLIARIHRELRNSLDTLRLETDNQATFHLQLAEQIRTDMEGQVTAFCAKQTQHKKTQQSVIEKKLKTKQTQESYVNKAREKYEADLQRINTYGAQASALDGKDLERLQMKLQRAQQTVQANEKDLANFVKNLREVLPKWEEDWKGFCDSCQDLEEERLEFLRENIWTYANAVSTLCVSDDMVMPFNIPSRLGALTDHNAGLRENPCRVRPNGTRQGHGELRSRLWNRQHFTRSSFSRRKYAGSG